MRRLYDWVMAKANSPQAPHALFWVSFIESLFFPIPPDVMLVPMVIANRLKAWWYRPSPRSAPVIGGVFGYAIGYFFFEQIGQADPEVLRQGRELRRVHQLVQRMGRSGS